MSFRSMSPNSAESSASISTSSSSSSFLLQQEILRFLHTSQPKFKKTLLKFEEELSRKSLKRDCVLLSREKGAEENNANGLESSDELGGKRSVKHWEILPGLSLEDKFHNSITILGVPNLSVIEPVVEKNIDSSHQSPTTAKEVDKSEELGRKRDCEKEEEEQQQQKQQQQKDREQREQQYEHEQEVFIPISSDSDVDVEDSTLWKRLRRKRSIDSTPSKPNGNTKRKKRKKTTFKNYQRANITDDVVPTPNEECKGDDSKKSRKKIREHNLSTTAVHEMDTDLHNTSLQHTHHVQDITGPATPEYLNHIYLMNMRTWIREWLVGEPPYTSSMKRLDSLQAFESFPSYLSEGIFGTRPSLDDKTKENSFSRDPATGFYIEQADISNQNQNSAPFKQGLAAVNTLIGDEDLRCVSLQMKLLDREIKKQPYPMRNSQADEVEAVVLLARNIGLYLIRIAIDHLRPSVECIEFLKEKQRVVLCIPSLPSSIGPCSFNFSTIHYVDNPTSRTLKAGWFAIDSSNPIPVQYNSFPSLLRSKCALYWKERKKTLDAQKILHPFLLVPCSPSLLSLRQLPWSAGMPGLHPFTGLSIPSVSTSWLDDLEKDMQLVVLDRFASSGGFLNLSHLQSFLDLHHDDDKSKGNGFMRSLVEKVGPNSTAIPSWSSHIQTANRGGVEDMLGSPIGPILSLQVGSDSREFRMSQVLVCLHRWLTNPVLKERIFHAIKLHEELKWEQKMDSEGYDCYDDHRQQPLPSNASGSMNPNGNGSGRINTSSMYGSKYHDREVILNNMTAKCFEAFKKHISKDWQALLMNDANNLRIQIREEFKSYVEKLSNSQLRNKAMKKWKKQQKMRREEKKCSPPSIDSAIQAKSSNITQHHQQGMECMESHVSEPAAEISLDNITEVRLEQNQMEGDEGEDSDVQLVGQSFSEQRSGNTLESTNREKTRKSKKKKKKKKKKQKEREYIGGQDPDVIVISD